MYKVSIQDRIQILMPDDSQGERISAAGLKDLTVRSQSVFTHNLCMSTCKIAVSVPKTVNEISLVQQMDSKEK